MSRLLAIGLGLPEETFVDMHGYDAIGETYGDSVFCDLCRSVLMPVMTVRFMK